MSLNLETAKSPFLSKTILSGIVGALAPLVSPALQSIGVEFDSNLQATLVNLVWAVMGLAGVYYGRKTAKTTLK